mmetsp:Transcript_5287/g.5430  ORF Transcript_5287/g.5430 Transcript_5287/m.5430 type:complete len:345 (+) Transcript_5287:134-1168(+)
MSTAWMIQNYDYFVSSIPLIIGHLIIPPLSYFEHGQTPHPLFDMLYDSMPANFHDISFINSLILNIRSAKLHGPDLTIFTYMFVHADYNHLLNNLSACIQLGLPIYKELGADGLYSLFLFGGAFSVLPSILYSFQKDQLLKDIHKIASAENPYLPKVLTDTWSRSIHHMSKSIIQNVPLKYIGSSGGVSALMGADIIIMIKQCVEVVRQEYRELHRHTRPSRPSRPTPLQGKHAESHASDDHLSTLSLVQAVLRRVMQSQNKTLIIVNILHIVRSVTYLSSEIGNAYTSRTSHQSWDVLIKSFERFQTNHVAHIQGALFGAAFASVFCVLLPYLQRSSRRRIEL